MSTLLLSSADQVTIGVDFAKDHLDVDLHPGTVIQQFTNDLN